MIGINPAGLRGRIDRARPFVNGFGLTFDNLLDGTDGVYRHYGRPYNSHYWLLDRNGDRVGSTTSSFSATRIERALDNLEQGG